MRPSILVFLVSLAAAGVCGTGRPAPVLVELFTSEGCSSCPPADALLMELQEAGEVCVLSEHVDYWNRLGWVDPFASAQFSERQKHYADRLRSGIYTPQMVVDGRTELVGSDKAGALRAIADAARQPKAAVAVAPGGGGSLAIRVEPLPGAQGPLDVYLAVTEGRLHSQVLRGENAGRRLEHTAVVRRLTVLGGPAPGQAFTATPQVAVDPGWKRGDLRAVVFVQERMSGRILGTAATAF